MEFMKELSLNIAAPYQVYMLLYMGGRAPTNAAELNAAVDTHDFTDMWNKSIGCSYVTGAKSQYNGEGVDWTTFFSPKSGCGQLKGAPMRSDGHRIGTGLSTSVPLLPDTIEYQTADGVKIPKSGWLGLFGAQCLIRGVSPVYGAMPQATYWTSPVLIPEFSPVAHIVLGFNETKTFTGISSDSTMYQYGVDYWNGSTWVQCVALHPSKAPDVVMFDATTSKIRIRIQTSYASDHLGSLILFGAPQVQAARPLPDIRWALMIPVGSRPVVSGSPINQMILDKEITRGTKIPFYALSVGGPGGTEEILLSKNTALTSDDYPTPTGFYIKSGNFVGA